MKNFLLIGLDPGSIDYSAPGVPAGMTAEKLLAIIADVQKHFADQGDHLDNCKVKPDGSANDFSLSTPDYPISHAKRELAERGVKELAGRGVKVRALIHNDEIIRQVQALTAKISA